MLTYCTNIHPAESWADSFANVRRYVPLVKKRISPERPFPIGLRLSGLAAGELDMAAAAQFQEWCRENGCFVSTINGFPYGIFHHVPVKETVYLPDWRDPERLRYTGLLAQYLALWLPEGLRGSISTVPVGFKESIGPEDFATVRSHLVLALQLLEKIAQKSGKEILLAMEPEPACVLETTMDVVHFFEQLNLPDHLRPFLAVCYDCCHQALQYESPAQSLALLKAHGIRVGQVQVSSALRLEDPDIRRMQRFSEPCYLHQTVGRRQDGTLLRYHDLDQALAAAPAGVPEWRIHFHIPVFVDRLTDCASTQPFLTEILPLFGDDVPLEVETYTWTVLPPELQTAAVTDSIIREIEWVRKHRQQGTP
jgi:hypothetical protein